MKIAEVNALIEQAINDSVEAFGQPLIERLEVVILKIAQMDKRKFTTWCVKNKLDGTRDQNITWLATRLQDQWLEVQIEHQRKIAQEKAEAEDAGSDETDAE